MKKNYIRPESKLFAINLDEDIAQPSGGDQDGGYTGTTNGVHYTMIDEHNGYFATDTKYSFYVESDDIVSMMLALADGINRYREEMLNLCM